MDGSKATSSRPVWGAKSSWASSSSSSPSTASSSRDPTPSASASASASTASAFPPLSSPQARRPTSRSNSTNHYASPSSSLISPTSFNPYPTRRQELAQRAASHGTRKRSHITRSDPSTSRIHSLLDYEHDADDDVLMHDGSDDEGEVSSRGATMSSIVFRDLSSSASTSRSSSPWQQGGLSPGLAMFAATTFGGEPLRVLANVDEELGAAHMGPRIYKRHNQKHVRNRVKARIDANHSVKLPAKEMQGNGGGQTLGQKEVDMVDEEKDRLRSLDVQRLVDESRRHYNLSAVQMRSGSDGGPSSGSDSTPTTTLLAAIRTRVADARTWSTSSPRAIISDDLLPTGLQDSPIDFSVLPSPLLVQIRQTVLHALTELLDTVAESTTTELIPTLAHLLSLRALRPTNVTDPDLKPAVQQTFLRLLDTFVRLPNPSSALAALFTDVSDGEPDRMVDLVGELVGLCGQQMSSNPAVLTETQDATLVTVSSFLSLCFTFNATRPAAARLPVHAFYCTVLDLAPFLEHFVHRAAALARTTAPAAGMAEFNICRAPFLLSLGAKVRILQLENELRLSNPPARDGAAAPRFAVPGREAELMVLPTSLNLKVERREAWVQSRALFVQLLEAGVGVRGLRVEFVGEQAADGGGPAREWFATVASGWTDYRNVVGSHGWFIPSSDDKDAEDTAAFLGLLLALAALHTTKVALPFALPPVAFKIATAPNLDDVVLTPVDLEFADAPLAKSLQAVLDWRPPPSVDAERAFDSTFSLTWSTSIRTGAEIKTLDLVPGGRHRSVKLGERREYVSKLVARVLIGSVHRQVGAFRDAWQSVFPSSWLHAGEVERRAGESATEVLRRGGLALSLFSGDEVGQAILSSPSPGSALDTVPLDVGEIRGATEVLLPPSSAPGDAEVVSWFWELWSTLSPLHQRRMLAFITGAEDVPASGARGIGLRIHLVATEVADPRSWPLPWSSTCTSTLFLPTYPSEPLLQEKVRIAIEHYQGFGLR